MDSSSIPFVYLFLLFHSRYPSSKFCVWPVLILFCKLLIVSLWFWLFFVIHSLDLKGSSDNIQMLDNGRSLHLGQPFQFSSSTFEFVINQKVNKNQFPDDMEV